MEYKFALLIDSDNASSKDIEYVIEQISILGNILIKRIYGDFTSPQSKSWREVVNKYALTPVQQFTYTVGKNVTDSKMIIDAMDILYSGDVNAYCIMSSDSDFTGIVKRLKESGNFVAGAGKKTTPDSFINACDRFFNVDKIVPVKSKVKQKTKKKKEEKVTIEEEDSEIKVASVEEIFEYAKLVIANDANSNVLLADLVNKIYRKYPDFDPRTYGCKKAIDLFSQPKSGFVIFTRDNGAIAVSVK